MENFKEDTQFEAPPPRRKREKDPFSMLVFVVMFIVAGYLIFIVARSVGEVDLSGLKVFNTVFISILMQAFPFMLIGVFVSSFMHVFIPDDFIIKIFPTKHGLGFITAMFAGLFFPVCECAIVPVMTRLVKKGVAMPIAIIFMLSAPIINPIVILSTLYAFPGQPEVALYRVALGLVIALMVGLVLLISGACKSALIDKDETCECDGHDCDCNHRHHEHEAHGVPAKIKAMFLHSGEEFFGVGKYLVLGAFMTSLIQTLVPRAAFISMGEQSGLSLFFMMAAAFLFSACSTSDAFIARSFLDRLSLNAVMGFLVFGPMMDLKNILMLFHRFKKGFVMKLALLIFVLNFVILSIFSFLF